MNKIITVYELIGLIKDRKMPKNVIYREKIYQYDDELYDYSNSIGDSCLLEFIFSSCNNWLYEEVEILEENNEWKDINYELDDNKEHHFMNRQNGMTKEDRELLDSNFKLLGETINQLIKNQKYLKAMIENLQRPFMDEIKVDVPKWIEDPKRKVGE